MSAERRGDEAVALKQQEQVLTEKVAAVYRDFSTWAASGKAVPAHWRFLDNIESSGFLLPTTINGSEARWVIELPRKPGKDEISVYYQHWAPGVNTETENPVYSEFYLVSDSNIQMQGEKGYEILGVEYIARAEEVLSKVLQVMILRRTQHV